MGAAAKQSVNTRLPANVRVDPILILAEYTLGPCKSDEARPLLDSVSYKNCKNFPAVLEERLKKKGFDVKLEIFDPMESVGQDRFKWRKLQESMNPDRYVLRYTGTLSALRRGTVAILSLFGKAGEESQGQEKGRADLGTFSIKEKFWTKKEAIGSYGVIERSVPLADVADILVNTLEARCATAGFLRECVDRLPLDDPR